MENIPNLHNFLYPERDHTWTKEEFIAYEEAVDSWNWEKFKRETAARLLPVQIERYKNFSYYHGRLLDNMDRRKLAVKDAICCAEILIQELKKESKKT